MFSASSSPFITNESDQLLSENDPLPNNSMAGNKGSVYVNNRFSRSYNTADFDIRAIEDYRRRTQLWGNLNPSGAGGTPRKTLIRWDAPYYQADLRKQWIAKVFEVDEEAAISTDEKFPGQNQNDLKSAMTKGEETAAMGVQTPCLPQQQPNSGLRLSPINEEAGVCSPVITNFSQPVKRQAELE